MRHFLATVLAVVGERMTAVTAKMCPSLAMAQSLPTQQQQLRRQYPAVRVGYSLRAATVNVFATATDAMGSETAQMAVMKLDALATHGHTSHVLMVPACHAATCAMDTENVPMDRTNATALVRGASFNVTMELVCHQVPCAAAPLSALTALMRLSATVTQHSSSVRFLDLSAFQCARDVTESVIA
jgi:hypothetical protein